LTLLTRKHDFGSVAPLRSPVVKTCGIIRVDHALAAARFGASMIGLVFARSRRTVSVEVACAIRQALEGLAHKPLLVGVFVNELPQAILAIADQAGLDFIQLSGDETPTEVEECARHYPVLKALRFPMGVTSEAALGESERYRALVPMDRLRFLIDTYHPGEYGGTGRVGDWGIAAELARREEIILAGGLTPNNVAQAVKEVAPWGVDVSSGIERDGVKDPGLIEVFIANARQSHARGRR